MRMAVRIFHFVIDVIRGLKLWRLGDSFQGRPPPVRLGSNVTVHRAKKSRLVLKGTLIFGYQEFVTGLRITGRPTRIKMEAGSRLVTSGKVNIGSGCKLDLEPGACLEIGHRSYVNVDSVLRVGRSVRIGKECAIAWDVEISDTDDGGISPIHIEDHVWIGAGARIHKGVRLNSGSVVSAGAVVTEDVPGNCIVAGNPARVIREGIRWVL